MTTALFASMLLIVAPAAADAKQKAIPKLTPVTDLGSSRSPSGAKCRAYSFKVLQTATDTTRQSVWGQLCYRRKFTSKTPVQVLIHGGGYNHTYWDSPFKPDTYSYVRAATRRGYATLNFDRLGYGLSDHPDPMSLNFNVAGFVTHQLVGALRDGSLGSRFSRVILNGHSMGAAAAENEAANYKDVDGVILSGIGHNFSAFQSATAFYPAVLDPKFGTKVPLGYLTTVPGQRLKAFVSPGTYDPDIVSTEEGVEKDTLSANELMSLSDDTSDTSTVTQRITSPVLFAQGRYDQLWCNGTGDCTTDPQAAKEPTYYKPGVSFTREVIPSAGHSINSSVTAPAFYRRTFFWLTKRKLAPKCWTKHQRTLKPCRKR